MTQETKLKILGPYTPDHEGPFCTRDGSPVEVITVKGRGLKRILGYIGDEDTIAEWREDGTYLLGVKTPFDIMNAREVPVAREFWVNECRRWDGSICNTYPHETECEAMRERHELPHWNWVRTIHVREVLPGEDE